MASAARVTLGRRAAAASSARVPGCRRPSRLLGAAGRAYYASGAAAAPHAHQGLKIQGDRLWKDLHETSKWGTGTRWGSEEHQTGMSRLALTDDDKHVRDWFVDTTRSLGCEIIVDSMGNIFARRGGKQDGPPTYAGSHLDTQPTGGRYDGVLGVMAGIEMLRTLKENNIETEYPVGVINWTNEEGARFPRSMVSSGVWAGEISIEDAHNLKEVGGGARTMKQELARIGYLGETPASYQYVPIGAHFELHIEQGPILQDQGLKIGVVSGAQAYNWSEVTVTGRDCHTGTTPLAAREDALLFSCGMIRKTRAAAEMIEGGLASTGIFKAYPGSVNTVPGKVEFTLDIRSRTDDDLALLDKRIQQLWKQSLENLGKPIKIDRKITFSSPAAHFNRDCIRCVRQSAKALVGDSHLTMQSGAGHDTVFVSKRAPASMIFVPCKDGVSHHPEEYCAPDDCANGTQALLDSVLAYDQLRTSTNG